MGAARGSIVEGSFQKGQCIPPRNAVDHVSDALSHVKDMQSLPETVRQGIVAMVKAASGN